MRWSRATRSPPRRATPTEPRTREAQSRAARMGRSPGGTVERPCGYLLLELVEERPGFCGAPAARLLSVVRIGRVVAFERAELQWVSGHAAGQLGADMSP